MANRAYLYSADKELKVIRDISEWRSEVSLLYKIVLGVNTKVCNSQIWNYEKPICISGEMKAGLDKLNAFYNYLKTQSQLDVAKIEEYQKTTNSFFEEHPDRLLEIFFMEGGEVYDLTATDNYPIEKENEYVYQDTLLISANINEILETKPVNLFEHTEKYKWVDNIKKDISCLEPYWTHVTYFSFNKTGVS